MNDVKLIELQYVKRVVYEVNKELSDSEISETEIVGQRYPLVEVNSRTVLVPTYHPIGCIGLYEVNGTLVIGYSVCAPEDQFSKKRAREITEARAINRFESGYDEMTKEDFKKFPSDLREDAVLIHAHLWNVL